MSRLVKDLADWKRQDSNSADRDRSSIQPCLRLAPSLDGSWSEQILVLAQYQRGRRLSTPLNIRDALFSSHTQTISTGPSSGAI